MAEAMAGAVAGTAADAVAGTTADAMAGAVAGTTAAAIADMSANRMAGKRRAFLRSQRGSLSVEAAYVLPVIIAAAMMFMELANIGLTINMGASALERAVQQFRQDGAAGQLEGGAMETLVRQRMVAASHNYLDDENIATVEIERFASLDAMGGGAADEENTAAALTNVPAWRIEVDVRKDFITPLPRLLGVDSGAFRYRYQQVLAYLPQRTEAGSQ